MIVDLDEIFVRWIGVGQEFIDHHVAQWIPADRIRTARGSADPVALIPGERVILAVTGPGQHEGVAGAIGRDRPGRLGVIVYLQQHRTRSVAQAHRASVVGQIVCVRAEHSTKTVNAHHVCRDARDDEETAAGNLRAIGKRVIDRA